MYFVILNPQQHAYHNASVNHERNNRRDVGIWSLTNDAVVETNDWPTDLGTTPPTVVRKMNNFRRCDGGIGYRLSAHFYWRPSKYNGLVRFGSHRSMQPVVKQLLKETISILYQLHQQHSTNSILHTTCYIQLCAHCSVHMPVNVPI